MLLLRHCREGAKAAAFYNRVPFSRAPKKTESMIFVESLHICGPIRVAGTHRGPTPCIQVWKSSAAAAAVEVAVVVAD